MGLLFANSKKVVHAVVLMDFHKVVFEWVAWLKSDVFFSPIARFTTCRIKFDDVDTTIGFQHTEKKQCGS